MDLPLLILSHVQVFPYTCFAISDENYRADAAAQTDLRSKWSFENSSPASSAQLQLELEK